jgi:hypothetical protein
MKATFLILLLFTSIHVAAHSDYTITMNKGNLHLQYTTGWTLEMEYRLNILLELGDRLLKAKGFNNEHMFIYFDYDYTKRDTAFYALGYGEFTYREFKVDSLSFTSKEFTRTGLKLIIRDRDIDIQKMLNLICSAFRSPEYIRKMQSPVKTPFRLFPEGEKIITSIPKVLIGLNYNSTDSTVTRLVNEKTYRFINKTGKPGEVDYYYQNNRFHFYSSEETVWLAEQGKYELIKDPGKDILVVDKILEISGSTNDGHFVFTDDSTFYFIDHYPSAVRGSFEIDSIRAGRRPIKYDYETSPMKRFTIHHDVYRKKRKALFFPDSNLVISNFENTELKFLLSRFEKPAIKKDSDKSKTPLAFILAALGLSGALNLWLWKRQGKSQPKEQ